MEGREVGIGGGKRGKRNRVDREREEFKERASLREKNREIDREKGREIEREEDLRESVIGRERDREIDR